MLKSIEKAKLCSKIKILSKTFAIVYPKSHPIHEFQPHAKNRQWLQQRNYKLEKMSYESVY